MLEQGLRDHTPARLTYPSITGKIHDQYIFKEQIDFSVYTSTIFQAKYT
mgnify:CR=1 FL=1